MKRDTDRICLRRTKIRSLVAAVLAVKVAVTLPTGGDALTRDACELGVADAVAEPTCAFFICLVLSIGTVLLSITHPVGRNADISFHTMELIFSTRGLHYRCRA